MKKTFRSMFAVFLAASMSIALTACDPETEDANRLITFEDVVLDARGVWNGSDKAGTLSSYEEWGSVVNSYTSGFSSGILNCTNVFYQDQTYFSTWWSGMACSNHNDKDSIGYGNQYSVYAPAGAAGSAKFAIVGSDSAFCSFTVPVEIKSLMYNNSTYVYWALKDGMDGSGVVRKFEAGDFFLVTVSGYDSTNVKTGEVIIPLADFRNSKSYICSDWTKISLESLGKVTSLVFHFSSSDTGDWGMNTPAYICIDNIEYQK